MDDMISRAAATKRISDMIHEYREKGEYRLAEGMYLALQCVGEQLPAVDAAPVVRCSECKYAYMTYDGECKYCDFWQEDGGDALYLDKGFYCAAGERRDGDTE